MTKAKTSVEHLALDKHDSSPRTSKHVSLSVSGKNGAHFAPSPSSSPSDLRAQTLPGLTAPNYASPYPEPPDTPPPLAPAIAPAGFLPHGASSSCSSTPSIPELQYPSAQGQTRLHVQVDFTSARSAHSHSPEQSYAGSVAHGHGSGSGFPSPTEMQSQTAAWVYGGHAQPYHQQQQQYPQQQHQKTRSMSPTQRTQTAHPHAMEAQYGYDYPENNYSLQYPDTPPAQTAEYAQPIQASSRHSVAHMSPSRPAMSMLTSESASAYQGAAPRYDGPTNALLTRYMAGGTAQGTSPSTHHGHAVQGQLVESYAPAAPAPSAVVEPTRGMYAGYGSTQSAHRYDEQDESAAAYYAAGYGSGAGTGRSPPPTLPPIQTARIVRDDLAVDSRHAQQQQPQHAQPHSAVDAAPTQASYPYSYQATHAHQQQQQQHMSTEHPHQQHHPHTQAHAHAQDRSPNGQHTLSVPLHQPRPHYSPQQYVALYAPTAGAAAGAGGGAASQSYYRRDSHDHVIARVFAFHVR
ncbi:uncharacterized protein C8Q71DRAFT_179598 [Rhodofomes roseus]|uniref:Uncharacterized protein n=1 Tax=Rhodofomes roseus TaxID=34475 RepID=A0ABQ8K9B3_9APHY|nr:uncharacterized protein C8Q71DRAFT_179598 [Rhodofomes roseus]KAH9833880.1 hypothetical protein C8Q71DRAFT_179598 [Rhodofomes roseus]